MTTPYQVVLVTAPDKKTAVALAEKLVDRKLAACVNIVDSAHSIYRWENEVKRADEALMLIKTRGALVPEVVFYVKENHPYKVPEVISLPIEDGNPEYMDWLGASCKFASVNESGKFVPRPSEPPKGFEK